MYRHMHRGRQRGSAETDAGAGVKGDVGAGFDKDMPITRINFQLCKESLQIHHTF